MPHDHTRSFQDFVGKTVQSVDASLDNFIVFYFTDGSKLALEVEMLGLPPRMPAIYCAEVPTEHKS